MWNCFFNLASLKHGVASIPPPNQFLPVIICRVLKCNAGTFGFAGWSTTDTPEDQNLLSFSVPGICFANSFGKVPVTFENAIPPFSITLPLIILYSPFFHLLALNFAFDPFSFSSSLTVSQIKFCNSLNPVSYTHLTLPTKRIV